MTAAWKELMQGVNKDDIEEKKRRMEPIYTELEEWRKLRSDPDFARVSSASRMRSALRQFTSLVR